MVLGYVALWPWLGWFLDSNTYVYQRAVKYKDSVLKLMRVKIRVMSNQNSIEQDLHQPTVFGLKINPVSYQRGKLILAEISINQRREEC